MSPASHKFRLKLLVGAAIAPLLLLFAHRMPQPRGYHLFADVRTYLGIPNFFNAASNFAFLIVGLGMLAWLYSQRRHFPRMFIESGEAWMFAVMYGGTILVTFGSAYYHLAPDNARLFWDRLPMTLVGAAFVGTILADRFGARAGGWAMTALFVLSCGALIYWRTTQSAEQDNVWPYFVTLYGSLAVAGIAMALFASRYTHGHVAWGALAIYGIAMAFDTWLDRPLYNLGGVLSGHSFKHVLAALALGWLGWGALSTRTARPGAER